MKIIKIEKEALNAYIAQKRPAQFLQSFQWGDFQKNTGKRIIRLGFIDQGKIFFALTLIKNRLFTGMAYFYAPRIRIDHLDKKQLEFVFGEIAKIAQEEKAIFLRFEPAAEFRTPDLGLRILKTVDVQPSKTLLLDLSNKTEEEILQGMHQKTRYNIRLASKKGVTIRAAKKEDFDAWWKIMAETRKRDGFRPHSKDYYRNMQKIDIIKLFIAEYRGKIAAGNITAYFGDTAAYVHGASSSRYRTVMAPYSLQWAAIKAAREKGCKYYDFYGIDENKWPGVTRFKQGFGGTKQAYPGTFDLIFDPIWYNGYKFLRKIRRII